MKQETDYCDFIKTLLLKNKIKFKKIIYTDQIDTLAYTIQEINGIAIVHKHISNMQWNDLNLIEIDNEISCWIN